MKTITERQAKDLAKQLGIGSVWGYGGFVFNKGYNFTYALDGTHLAVSYKWWALTRLVAGKYLIFNTHRYSPTTAGHVNTTYSILNSLQALGLMNYEVIEVDAPTNIGIYTWIVVLMGLLKLQIQDTKQSLSKRRTAKTKERDLNKIKYLEEKLAKIQEIEAEVDFNKRLTGRESGYEIVEDLHVTA